MSDHRPSVNSPLWLLAELTYRCPLHCVFCSNPTDYARNREELSTKEWIEVLRQARALGAVQVGFSGGEPLMRADLEILVDEAHRLGYYTNLITSGVGATAERLAALKAAGLDHIQLSFQDSTRELNDFLSNTRTFELKQRVARLIKANGYPMVLNVVLHRYNLPHVDRIIEMAVALEADYLELANTQYYGWALVNRDQLLPDEEQVRTAEERVRAWRSRLGERCQILFVVPDYFEKRPKACMNGWGSVFLAVSPDGTALPCHAARVIPGLKFPNVRETPLAEVWRDSEAFNAFRGDAWMKEPCRSCDERHKDFGGCRCQAFLLTQSAANADPVCEHSPSHGEVERVITVVSQRPRAANRTMLFRSDDNSRRLHPGEESQGERSR